MGKVTKRIDHSKHRPFDFGTRRSFFKYILLLTSISGGIISFSLAKYFFGDNDKDIAKKDSSESLSTEKTAQNQDKKVKEPLEKTIEPNIDENKLDFKIVNVNSYGMTIREEDRFAEYFTENLGNNISLNMIKIVGGEFLMGWPKATNIEESIRKYNPESYESKFPNRQVIVSDFYIGQFLVSQAQYKAIMGNNPSRFRENSNHPVDSVYWRNAEEFCKKLSERTGKEYRLPSEAQWEYACRAGTTTPFHFGETITSDLANYNGTEVYAHERKGVYRGKTTPVGSFPANNFGLYDMHGNTWEWCADNWHDNYENAPTDGQAWLSGDDRYKVIRGGSLENTPGDCRSYYRTYRKTSSHDNSSVSFRVLCTKAV